MLLGGYLVESRKHLAKHLGAQNVGFVINSPLQETLALLVGRIVRLYLHCCFETFHSALSLDSENFGVF